MKPDFFWNSWPKPYKFIYQGLLVVFAISICAYIFTYFSGSTFVIDWEIENIVDPAKTLFDSLWIGLYEFPIYVDNYVISQSFIASSLQVNTWPAYILLIWLGIFISIMLALITDLSRFWFVASVILVTLLFVGLKLDYLLLFNSYEKIGLLVAFVLYFPSLYYFHFIKPNNGIAIRIFVHLGATAVFGLIIFKFSGVSLPFLHLANYGIYVPLILTILFALIIGHEILSSLLRVITSGAIAGDKNGLVHFLVISIIFFLNTVLVLLRNSKIIDVDLYVIGAFWLLTVASILGIWGYRTKETTYSGTFSFFPFGAFLFIGLAITAHFTISYFFISGNDSLVEAIEDVIIYSQLGYSLMFVVYVIANFSEMLHQNVDVGKVLYKPRRMPYFISRFAGVVVIMALFFRSNMIPYYQSVAGFYSGIGDLYLKSQDYLSAAEYYKLANVYSGTSHRANYAMATIEKLNGNSTEEKSFLKQAIRKNPTEFAFVNLASKYVEDQRFFEAIFTLRDGVKEFPNNAQLLNNLGLAYLNIENIDSAFYYLKQSAYSGNSSDETATNIYALLRLNDLSIKPDTLTFLLEKTAYLPAINNLVVLSNELGKEVQDKAKIQFGDPDNEKAEQLIYNFNKTLNSPMLVDSGYLEKKRIFYDSSSISWFQDNLDLASALALFHKGEVAHAFTILNQLAIQNPEKEYYNFLGNLSLKLKSYGSAVDYFKESFQQGHLEIASELAFAYMENGELDKALFIWRQIKEGGDPNDIQLATKMIEISEATEINEILYADEETRFAFLAYRYQEFDLEKLKGLALTFESEDIQALAFLRIFNAYIELNQQKEALDLLEKVGTLNISMEQVHTEINLAQCRYAYYFNDMEVQQRLYKNLESTDLIMNNFLALFEALNISEESLKAEKLESLGYKNPFFEPGVFEAANFFNDQMKDTDKAYDILLKAVNTNPFSIDLNQAYALQCISVGLKSYAVDTKEELRSMMPSVRFKTFELEFDEKMARSDANDASW